jgi:niacin transporter
MSSTGTEARDRLTLPAARPRALSALGLLLAAAVILLPVVGHLSGSPVRVLLPMHWPVLLAGLVFGWRSGLILGLAAPGLSWMISGMPFPVMIPSMTLELAAYGFLAGFFRETLKMGRSRALLLALLGGRAVFLAWALGTGAVAQPYGAYLKAAMLPGLPAALIQLLLLPLLAGIWVGREGRS